MKGKEFASIVGTISLLAGACNPDRVPKPMIAINPQTPRTLVLDRDSLGRVLTNIGSQPDFIKTPQPTPKPQMGYDYCVFSPADPDPLSAQAVGTPIPDSIYFQGSTDIIGALPLTLNNLKHPHYDDKYHVVLVPVGYDNPEKLEARMDYLTNIYERAYVGVDVSFSYLNISVPISISRRDRLAWPEDYQQITTLINKLNQFYLVDSTVEVLNTHDYVGAGGYTAVIPGENESTQFVAIHEEGHNLGLSDSYQIYQGEGFIDNTELFTTTKNLSPLVAQAYKDVRPQVFIVDRSTCNGYQVYAFAKGKTIMNSNFEGPIIQQKLNDGTIFDPMEKAVMNLYIARRLGK